VASPGPVASSQPAPSVPPDQAPDAVPTRGTGAQEAPLPQAKAKPVLTTAVAGTGSGSPVAPDKVCVFWAWDGDVGALTDGLWFTIDHPVVAPPTWTASRDACGDSAGDGPWCDGAKITVDQRTCAIGFVRSGAPSEQALVGMVGTLTCTDPLSEAECATLIATIDDGPDVSAIDLEAIAGPGDEPISPPPTATPSSSGDG